MRVVQKYGGTSVGTLDGIKRVARRIQSTYAAGNQVVVVVSARAGITNELIARAKTLHPHPDEREMDMLLSIGEQEIIALTAMALHTLDVPAVSLTGAQAGIYTDVAHTQARILTIDGDDIARRLNDRQVLIVAGFQGVTPEGHTTTLGRGGSDLSAIALSAVLKADLCQIYTDVDGVYTADPRIIPRARKIDTITYEEMLELASCGSQVMQTRAVELAQKYQIAFEIRSSFNHQTGTFVKANAHTLEAPVVTGIAVDKNQTKLTISGLKDKPGTAAKVFQALGEGNVSVDMIVQNIGREGFADLTFTVSRDVAERAEKAARRALETLGGGRVEQTGDVAKISVVGVGMRSQSGVAATLFGCLAKEEINIQLISTSEIKIEVTIAISQADRALKRLHTAFGLDITSVGDRSRFPMK